MRMAMGTHKQREKHEDIWIAHTELPLAPGHAFYQRLNGLLEADRSTSLSRAVAASWWNAPLPTAYETGGTRRMHLRGHRSILKRQLIQVGAFNLSLIPPKLMGPPRRGSGETAAAYCFCWHISYSHAGKAGIGCAGAESRCPARNTWQAHEAECAAGRAEMQLLKPGAAKHVKGQSCSAHPAPDATESLAAGGRWYR